MKEPRRIAKIRISNELLLEALRLPIGTVLYSVRDEELLGQVMLLIESPGLNPVQPGDAVPVVDAQWKAKEIRQVEFDCWVQKDSDE